MTKHRYSITLQIGSMFLILTAVIGIILIHMSYVHVETLLKATAKELSFENSRYIETEFKQKTAPIITTLDMLAYSSLINQGDEPVNDKPWLASLELIFYKYPHLVGLYFADKQGKFTMIRPLFDAEARQHFSAPESARLFINITQINGQDDTYFLDHKFDIVGHIHNNNNTFDPRARPWFKQSLGDKETRLTEPYMFHFLKEMGFTLSRSTPDGTHVVAADFTIRSISKAIDGLGFSSNSHVVVFDHKFNVIALKHQHPIEAGIEEPTPEDTAIFQPIIHRINSQTIADSTRYQDKTWTLTMTPIALSNKVSLMLAEATPEEDLLANLTHLKNEQLMTMLVSLIICALIVMLVASRIANPLKHMIQLSNNIARFEFRKTRYPKSMIQEVSDLSASLQLMEHALHDLLELLRNTAGNTSFEELAKTITHQSFLVTRAETILLYIRKDDGQFHTVANHAIIPFKIDINQLLNDTAWLYTQLIHGETIHINKNDNVITPYRTQLFNSDFYLFPLIDRHQKLVGLLNLGYERAITPQQTDKHAFLKELLSFAEIAKENLDKINQQKAMMNAFIELIASAIDTKSPYTGKHCQRVPTLCKWLVQAANDDSRYFPFFKLSKEHWEELELAAWLHDCGKVTTPEFVIDKATKLETIYDRIHEIRMRFELLKSYEHTRYWQSVSEGMNRDEAATLRDTNLARLDDDFAFVAKCNEGKESMSDEYIERLKQIAQIPWIRTLDDQLGTSWIEQQRASEKVSLPTEEKLLDNKPRHMIPWDSDAKQLESDKTIFTMQPGSLRYNRGELYNLSIRHGTLTDEERFIINDHIVQTISMLEKIPFPPHLRHVPEIAGSHHERVDGKGYPRSLNDEQLSVQSRAMAIADVFEALTSKDRPYKKAKSLETSINIMTQMATSGHLDPKLYLLFLEGSLYENYANQFLEDEQITPVDVESHVKKVKLYLKSLR